MPKADAHFWAYAIDTSNNVHWHLIEQLHGRSTAPGLAHAAQCSEKFYILIDNVMPIITQFFRIPNAERIEKKVC